MGALYPVIKTLIVPALIAFAAFLFLSFVVVPAWRFYRNRYRQYLPLDTLSTHTSSFRHRLQNIIGRFFSLVSTVSWRQRILSHGGDIGIGGVRQDGSSSTGTAIGGRFRGLFGGRDRHSSIDFQEDRDDDLLSGDDEDVGAPGTRFNNEEGQELGRIRNADLRRHELPRGGIAYEPQRLSRDLEQGFMDDSDDDDEPTRSRI